MKGTGGLPGESWKAPVRRGFFEEGLRHSQWKGTLTISLSAGDFKFGVRCVEAGLKTSVLQGEQELLRSQTPAPPWLVHILTRTQVWDREPVKSKFICGGVNSTKQARILRKLT